MKCRPKSSPSKHVKRKQCNQDPRNVPKGLHRIRSQGICKKYHCLQHKKKPQCPTPAWSPPAPGGAGAPRSEQPSRALSLDRPLLPPRCVVSSARRGRRRRAPKSTSPKGLAHPLPCPNRPMRFLIVNKKYPALLVQKSSTPSDAVRVVPSVESSGHCVPFVCGAVPCRLCRIQQ